MHEKISDITILTIIICTILLIVLGGIIISFLFAYQRKSHKHHQELLLLNENFNKTLLMSKLEIQEQTLDHIAKELHANISQLVSVININISTHIEQCKSEPDENIRETKLLVKQLMAEVKNLSVTLNTEHIRKAGFQRMLTNELDRLVRSGRYDVRFSKQGVEYRLPSEKEIILLRLCQEILNNIIKHAEASQIKVNLRYSTTQLSVEITDNGKGFDVNAVKKNEGRSNSTGLSNIYSRCRQIEGIASVNSCLGQGTSIQVIIPHANDQ